MKSIRSLFLFALAAFFSGKLCAQIKTYEAQWKKVDELIYNKRLPKSALDEVRKIYALAKKENQEAQVIKSLVYLSSLQRETREENEALAISEIEKELAAAKEPAASILKSMLAGLYWQYLQEHRWQFYNRTQTVNFNKADIATWTVEDLHKKISELFLGSLKNETQLRQTKLTPYEAVIIKGNLRHLRPTLYDLLAHQALEYFQDDERDIQKPAYAFEIDAPEAFAPAAQFVNHKFTTRDSLSLQHKALLIYQELLSLHATDAKPDALIDADIKRLEFVYRKSTAPDKDSLYKNALESLVRSFPGQPMVKQASFLLAQWYTQKASAYQPLKDTGHRYYYIIARDLLQNVVRDSAVKNEGWINSFNLLKTITATSFSFELEKVNLPAQPFRTLVTYRNIENLHFRLVKADDALKKQLEANDDGDKLWDLLAKATALNTWQQSLPATGDHQEHRTEIKVDALPLGEYYLVAMSDAKYDNKKTIIGARSFYVSTISYVHRKDNFFVLHRESGQPLSNASVQAYRRTYDYKTSKYIRTNIGSYKTDANGHFLLKREASERYQTYAFDVTHNGDRLNLGEDYYGYYYNNPDEAQPERKHVFYFTDRSIYRPGQTVYFKGIAVNTVGKNSTVAANYKTKAYLYNANYEITDSIELTTNEYGSFNGRFQLPQNSLNGGFRISDKTNSEVYFSVEEYKRPKFSVAFEKVKESYKVDETVNVTGKATAYAGNTIGGARVSYRVVRQPRYIYWWRFSKNWMPPVREMEIAHGEVTTDAEGKFTVGFTAIPDKEVDLRYDPVFDYRVYADVTDINGETRSGEHLVTAGYKSLVLQTEVPVRIIRDSFKTISIRPENLNGEYQPAVITVSLKKLQPEQRLVRERYWERPDQFVMSREEYIRLFPNDEYSNETDPETWAEISSVSRTDSSNTDGQWAINNKQLTTGYYKLEMITKDKDGKEVKDVKYVELYDGQSNALNKPEYLWTRASAPAEPGQTTTLQVGSSAADVFIISQIDKAGGKGVTEIPIGKKDRQPIPTLENREVEEGFSFSTLSNGKKTFNYAVTEADRGGFGVAHFFVKNNRFYEFTDVVIVPWTNKALDIEFATFRDKTLPGSEEKWKVKISGFKNDKVAAEMLASMYDASLDQFQPHQWNKPYLWKNYTGTLAWNSQLNFSAVESDSRWLPEESRQVNWVYDQLALDLRAMLYRSLGGRVPALRAQVVTAKGEAANLSMQRSAAPPMEELQDSKGFYTTANDGVTDTIANRAGKPQADVVQVRRNFNETAFFFPDLKTDAEGNIEFSFTAPEALTRWKLQTLAHTKELAFGLASREMVTQKELMVQPNMPRFLRQGDHIELSVKIVNLSDSELTGQAQLQLFDATTNQSVDGYFINSFPNQYFTVAAGQSEAVKFPIQVPHQFNKALVWRVVARSGNISDGEENAMPVLSNKVLVTETLPLPVRGNVTKNFTFKKLLESGNSETLQHQSLTVEYTSNPAWYAVQALPYLMDYPYECAEQTWNRYYANALAAKIANSSPRIKQIFERWKTLDTAALLSNLQKNQELKSALLEETPWVLQAKSESEQKKNIALLFDMVRMSNEMESNLAKLLDMQSSNGGFVWFKGGPDDRYITQYIVTGIGHLKKLGVETGALASVLDQAIPYLDKKIKEDYDRLVKSKAKLTDQHVGAIQIQYLYLRSFFPGTPVPAAYQTAFNYYKKQSQQFWTKQNKYMQGMIALTAARSNNKTLPAAILKSLKETSINNEELGMYWKDQSFGFSWHWSYAPIEMQALMIEAFNEIAKDTKTVDDLRTWLIKNKQTNNWRTTKATADACYAMLLQGTDWLSNEPVVQIKLGNTVVSNTNGATEAGTGYFKQMVPEQNIRPEMGNISVNVQQPQTPNAQAQTASSWGAVYWQYFEDMDKVTTASTPLKLEKKLFTEKNTDRGPVLAPVADGTELHVGDKIKVRIELRVDRDMEYVHMKDMRASALEPVNVLSGYRWQDGLGYYETTKDASTNFFFNYLRKGTYVFEYSLFVTNTGNFSNGITTIQCMYAPEFSAHSEGVRISVE